MPSLLALKHLHMALAALSLLVYALRGVWMMRQSPIAGRRWVRVLPHVLYTLLIVAGAALATLTGQWGALWIWLKLALLAAFIAIGTIAFSPRNSLPRARRMSVWGMGLVLFLMVFAVAAYHHAVMTAGVPPATMAPAAPSQPAQQAHPGQ
ncbi:MAG: SirB2 family protein [Pseudomonadota bacterium]|nr:SirB2 family protein [Pseudomonadota bacterium]